MSLPWAHRPLLDKTFFAGTEGATFWTAAYARQTAFRPTSVPAAGLSAAPLPKCDETPRFQPSCPPASGPPQSAASAAAFGELLLAAATSYPSHCTDSPRPRRCSRSFFDSGFSHPVPASSSVQLHEPLRREADALAPTARGSVGAGCQVVRPAEDTRSERGVLEHCLHLRRDDPRSRMPKMSRRRPC